MRSTPRPTNASRVLAVVPMSKTAMHAPFELSCSLPSKREKPTVCPPFSRGQDRVHDDLVIAGHAEPVLVSGGPNCRDSPPDIGERGELAVDRGQVADRFAVLQAVAKTENLKGRANGDC